MSITLKIGDLAPDFELPISDTEKFRLQKHRGKNIILYFYPRDHTPGCTTQAKNFRDNIARFQALNTEIIGVSKDTIASHQKFSDDYYLPFNLVSDNDNNICQTYGVWQNKQFMGKKFLGIVRTTFLIDTQGIIRKIWPKVSIAGHVEEIIKEINNL